MQSWNESIKSKKFLKTDSSEIYIQQFQIYHCFFFRKKKDFIIYIQNYQVSTCPLHIYHWHIENKVLLSLDFNLPRVIVGLMYLYICQLGLYLL